MAGQSLKAMLLGKLAGKLRLVSERLKPLWAVLPDGCVSDGKGSFTADKGYPSEIKLYGPGTPVDEV